MVKSKQKNIKHEQRLGGGEDTRKKKANPRRHIIDLTKPIVVEAPPQNSRVLQPISNQPEPRATFQGTKNLPAKQVQDLAIPSIINPLPKRQFHEIAEANASDAPKDSNPQRTETLLRAVHRRISLVVINYAETKKLLRAKIHNDILKADIAELHQIIEQMDALSPGSPSLTFTPGADNGGGTNKAGHTCVNWTQNDLDLKTLRDAFHTIAARHASPALSSEPKSGRSKSAVVSSSSRPPRLRKPPHAPRCPPTKPLINTESPKAALESTSTNPPIVARSPTAPKKAVDVHRRNIFSFPKPTVVQPTLPEVPDVLSHIAPFLFGDGPSPQQDPPSECPLAIESCSPPSVPQVVSSSSSSSSLSRHSTRRLSSAPRTVNVTIPIPFQHQHHPLPNFRSPKAIPPPPKRSAGPVMQLLPALTVDSCLTSPKVLLSTVSGLSSISGVIIPKPPPILNEYSPVSSYGFPTPPQLAFLSSIDESPNIPGGYPLKPDIFTPLIAEADPSGGFTDFGINIDTRGGMDTKGSPVVQTLKVVFRVLLLDPWKFACRICQQRRN